VIVFRVIAAGMLVVSPVQVVSQQKIPTRFNQGVAHVAGGWIFSGTDVLGRVDERLKVVAEHDSPIPTEWAAKGYNHVGDVDVVNGVLYVPFEQPDYNAGRQATARFDPATLSFVDAVELPQHENSFVAVDGSTMTAYTMDHFDGDTLLRYQLPAWTPLPPLHMSTTLHHTQGGAVTRGVIWISTSDDGNHVYRVDIGSGRVDRIASLGAAGEGEGIDATATAAGQLHVARNVTGTLDVLFEHLDSPHAQNTWVKWLVPVIAVPVFVWIGGWWFRTLRRKRSS
jgi:hypothetical protein